MRSVSMDVREAIPANIDGLLGLYNEQLTLRRRPVEGGGSRRPGLIARCVGVRVQRLRTARTHEWVRAQKRIRFAS
jgi:hypothetical protein